MLIAGALNKIAPEALDLIGRHRAEFLIERVAGFQLLAVDQQRARTRQPVTVFVVVAEQLETALDPLAIAFAYEPRDEVVDQFRGRGVVAYDDEHRRHADPGLLPLMRGFSVMAV